MHIQCCQNTIAFPKGYRKCSWTTGRVSSGGHRKIREMSNSPFDIRTGCSVTGQPENITYKILFEKYFVPCFPERFTVVRNFYGAGYGGPTPNLWGSPYWNVTVNQWYGEVDQFSSNNVSPYV
jgi:hypothetical protein